MSPSVCCLSPKKPGDTYLRENSLARSTQASFGYSHKVLNGGHRFHWLSKEQRDSVASWTGACSWLPL